MSQPITLESEGVPIEVQECRKRGQLVCFQRRVDAWVTHVDIVSPFGPGGIHSAAHCRLLRSLVRYEKDGDRATLDLAERHEGVLTTGRRGGGRAELAADRGGGAGAGAVPAEGLEAGPRGHRAESADGPEAG